jgi:hypothetical protein
MEKIVIEELLESCRVIGPRFFRRFVAEGKGRLEHPPHGIDDQVNIFVDFVSFLFRRPYCSVGTRIQLKFKKEDSDSCS